MCAEREPLDCHRALLIGRSLAARNVAVAHILFDGKLEPHDDTMDRLLDSAGLPRGDLLHSREELIAEAVARKEGRTAYAVEAP